jgi:hypothetical protein
MRRTKKIAALIGALLLAGGAGGAVAATIAEDAPSAQAAQGQSTRILGSGISENKFTPIVPCRILDTRQATAGRLQVGSARVIDVRGGEATFVQQGGNAGGCGIPSSASAIEATITAVDAGSGFLRAWPANLTQPNATFMNYGPGLNISNTGTITLCGYSGQSCVNNQDLNLRAYGSATHLVVDVSGYYVPPMAAVVNFNGALTRNSRAVSASRGATGIYFVAFDRDISQCTYFANLGNVLGSPQSGSVTATDLLINSTTVEVRTYSTAGALADRAFHLEVVC